MASRRASTVWNWWSFLHTSLQDAGWSKGVTLLSQKKSLIKRALWTAVLSWRKFQLLPHRWGMPAATSACNQLLFDDPAPPKLPTPTRPKSQTKGFQMEGKLSFCSSILFYIISEIQFRDEKIHTNNKAAAVPTNGWRTTFLQICLMRTACIMYLPDRQFTPSTARNSTDTHIYWSRVSG